MKQKANLKFMMTSVWHIIAMGLGSGLSPIAPGTFGTLMAIPMYLIFQNLNFWIHFIITISLFLIGIKATNITDKALQSKDNKAIVIDEIVSMWLLLLLSPPIFESYTNNILILFLLFRLFDITKPPPIKQLDAKLKNSLGIMIDDLAAMLFSLGSWHILIYLLHCNKILC